MLVGILGIGGLLGALAWGSLTSAEIPDSRAASAGEIDELTDVFRRYERAYFHAMVSGDASALPTVLYNDPTVEIRPQLQELSRRYHTQISDVLTRAASRGPVGAESGFLSAQIAYIENINAGIEAWEQEVNRANAEGRQASPVNLAPGMSPYQRPSPVDWVDDVPVQLLNVTMGGNHATADIVFVEPELLAEYLDRPNPYMQHYTFTQIDDQWYISNIWSEGNP